MSEKKPRADAKLKNLSDQQQEDLWRCLHPSEGEDRKPMTLEEAQGEVPLRYGFTVSLSALSEWRSWYALKRRTESTLSRIDQAQEELRKADPNVSAEKLEQLGQMIFTAESIEGGQVKAFVALMRERSRREELEINKRKLALLEDAARQAKAKLEAAMTAAKSGGGLTPEALKQIEEAAGLL